jgi:hypothetical protein
MHPTEKVTKGDNKTWQQAYFQWDTKMWSCVFLSIDERVEWRKRSFQ